MTPHFAQRISGLSGSVARDILSRSQDRKIVSFAGGLPDAALWADLELPSVASLAFQYGPSEGDFQLREILAARASDLGITTCPELTLITSGSQQGLDLVAKLFLEPGTPILTESPTYLAALQVFQLFQAAINPLPMDTEGIQVAALEDAIHTLKPRFIYLNPSYQNPTGICYSEERRKAIAAVLDNSSTVLIEDEPYRELAFEKATPAPICSYLKSGNWIHLSSVSKTLIPGLRLGSACSSPELFPHLLKLKQAADLHSCRVAQHMAIQLLSDKGVHDARIHKTIAHYRDKRDRMQESLEQHFTHLADWDSPTGGMFFWLRLKSPTDLKQALEAALSQGIAFMPGSPFYSSPDNSPPTIRLNFTLPTVSEIQTQLPRLAKFLENAATRIPAGV